MSIGFSVRPLTKRAHPKLIEQFRKIVTPHISDSMNRIHGVSSKIIPHHKKGKLVGTALTVKTRPGDNLMIHKAINMTQPGDVLVIDGGGDMNQALFGEIMLRMCQARGVAGLVIDGCIRDIKAFREDTFPVFARGVTHKGPYKQGPGEVNVPVSIGGLIVNPGDIILGDEDGLVTIPQDEAEMILEKAIEKDTYEKERIQAILRGEITESFIDDDTLEKMGCIIYKS